jgi:thioredoxin-like negative regulator of GroEL
VTLNSFEIHFPTLEYETAGKKLKGTGLFLAKVDATVYPSLAKQFSIEGFPTLMLFRKGEHVENYSGERKADAISTVPLDHLTFVRFLILLRKLRKIRKKKRNFSFLFSKILRRRNTML